MAANEKGFDIPSSIDVKTLGGNLNVCFQKEDGNYKNIHLSGKVSLVFHGELVL